MRSPSERKPCSDASLVDGMNRRDRPGTITRIEVQQKRQDRVNVHVDDEFAFSLSLLVAEEAGLRRGQALDETAIRGLQVREGFQRAYDGALTFLSYRPRSEAEVRDNLRRKGVAPEVADGVVTRLRTAGLIDDAAFARYWVENRDSFSPRGARALRAELGSKRVAREIIAEAVEARREETESAYSAGAKKARQIRGVDYRTFRQRLGAYLARRGFDYEAASAAVEALWREQDGEHQEDIGLIAD